MTAKERYEKCKRDHVCYYCGSPTTGRTRCDWCRTKMNRNQREREKRKMESSDYADAKRQYIKKWLETNPDKVAIYNGRKSEYNRRYREGWSE